MTPEVAQLSYIAHQKPDVKFSSIFGLIFRKEGLGESFRCLPGNKAPGIDGINKEQYGQDLEQRLTSLSKRLRDLAYIPQPVRRVYIPKLDGGRRPLGIPSFEDRIVQDRTSQVLQAIWEVEFRGCSYGFRPNTGAHAAVRELAKTITMEPIRYIVEADIKGFFNNVNHDWLMKFLEHRIKDKRFLRLIWRFLKAGVMEDGAVQSSEEGTPQGGLASPVLANIYLHYVLDLWVEISCRRKYQGKIFLIRYADDFVVCFERRDDAESFMIELPERLKKFGLETEPKKTKIVRFGRWAERENKAENKANDTFSFLGFTHFIAKSRKGNFLVGRKTEKKRIRKKLRELGVKLKALRIMGAAAMFKLVQQHLQGHINYYGVSGNSRALNEYKRAVERVLFKWLNQRSQRPSITWPRFNKILQTGLLPKVRIVHNMYNFFETPLNCSSN